MKRYKYFTFFMITIFLISGCASIVSKSSYPVTINSQPDQAEITIADETGRTVFKGKTPTTVTLDTKKGYFKGKDYTITFCKKGCTTHTAQVKRNVDGWYIAGNLFFGGLIGWLVVDPLTGAMWTLDDEINVVLAQAAPSKLETSSLNIMLIDDVPSSMQSKMIKIK
jgi:uncharacterized protein YceK